MASASFTRDEVILALDVMYFSKSKSLTANAPEIKELSYLLNQLPIHPELNDREGFRSPLGIAQQLRIFRLSMKNGEKSPQIGKPFFEVFFDFENDMTALHKIAQSIRRNQVFFSGPLGSIEEESFPEGALLGRLHLNMERKASLNTELSGECEVCHFKPELQYKACGNLLQRHLIVPMEELDGTKKYNDENFLTVCPTCHAALHRYRPWLTKENCGDVLC